MITVIVTITRQTTSWLLRQQTWISRSICSNNRHNNSMLPATISGQSSSNQIRPTSIRNNSSSRFPTHSCSASLCSISCSSSDRVSSSCTASSSRWPTSVRECQVFYRNNTISLGKFSTCQWHIHRWCRHRPQTHQTVRHRHLEYTTSNTKRRRANNRHIQASSNNLRSNSSSLHLHKTCSNNT